MACNIHYSETDLYLYKTLWELRHVPDLLFSVRLERKTPSGQVFSIYSRFGVCPSYGEVDITYLVIKAGLSKTRSGLIYIGRRSNNHAHHMMDTFLHAVRNILVANVQLPESELYDTPASTDKLKAINFDK